jgi:uncharacterized protein YjbJ (UPF0337 family)
MIRRRRKAIMDSDRIAGDWKVLRGKVREKWGKLTNNDLDVIDGRITQLVGRVQKAYGLEKDAAKKEVDGWIAAQKIRAKEASV